MYIAFIFLNVLFSTAYLFCRVPPCSSVDFISCLPYFSVYLRVARISPFSNFDSSSLYTYTRECISVYLCVSLCISVYKIKFRLVCSVFLHLEKKKCRVEKETSLNFERLEY
jgi:hypothetical protein